MVVGLVSSPLEVGEAEVDLVLIKKKLLPFLWEL